MYQNDTLVPNESESKEGGRVRGRDKEQTDGIIPSPKI